MNDWWELLKNSPTIVAPKADVDKPLLRRKGTAGLRMVVDSSLDTGAYIQLYTEGTYYVLVSDGWVAYVSLPLWYAAVDRSIAIADCHVCNKPTVVAKSSPNGYVPICDRCAAQVGLGRNNRLAQDPINRRIMWMIQSELDEVVETATILGKIRKD